ncbi:MAG: LamG domain-containing protein [Bacteriovoracaceae bacterium]|nr:LamG domain-containing protein [Bacteriovoracaceae bacterium]
MKNLVNLMMLVIPLLFSSCGSDSDPSGELSLVGLQPILTYSSSLKVDSSNVTSFELKGECQNIEKVIVGGSLAFEIGCINGSWSKVIDLTFLPNGLHALSIEAGEKKVDIELLKNSLMADSSAVYLFSDSSDLGKEALGLHPAVSLVDVIASIDNDRGVVAEFNGSSSEIQLSDGSFFNTEFSDKTFAFFMKSSDLQTNQVIFEEGGTTNGIALRVENDELILATRAGGSGTQVEVRGDLTGLGNSWIFVVAGFYKGSLELSINNVKTLVSTGYSSIPAHSDTGGIAKIFGSSVFDPLTPNPFLGQLSSLFIFGRALTFDEGALLAERDLILRNYDSLKLGQEASLDFNNVANPGEDSNGSPSGTAQNILITSDGDRGSVASFDGTSEIKLSNGIYWNNEFSQKAYALYFRSADLMTEQVIFEEGGSTNGISLRIENGYLFADARAGSGAPAQMLITDIIDLSDQWVKVVIQFDNGNFLINVNNGSTQVSRSAGFTSIPFHSSEGGLGRRFGGDASGNSGDAFFTGEIDKFSTYNRILSGLEIKNY